jgi:hypothetical protein
MLIKSYFYYGLRLIAFGLICASSQVVNGQSQIGDLFKKELITSENRTPAQSIFEGRNAVNFYNEKSTIFNDEGRLSSAKRNYPVTRVERVHPLLELGDPFLGNGPIRPGIKTPFGQMLQPSFLLFGSLRSAMQTSEVNNINRSEWSNRLDLHGNLNLSGTERLLFSLRPLDSEAGNSSGYKFNPDKSSGWQDDFNLRVTKLFFEGELGEIFPGLDPDDSHTFDIGFSVGRQRMLLQDGVLINDIIDMAGVTRNSLVLDGISNLRLSAFYGWNHINRGNNDLSTNDLVNNKTHSADVFGVSGEADTSLDNTLNLDLLYVSDKQDKNAFYAGLSSTQRFGWLNSTFRVTASIPESGESPRIGKGVLLMSQLSTTLPNSDNLLYVNGFWNIGKFTSAARSPDQGNPVANLGILFAPVGMGRFGVPLGQSIDSTIGAVIGYQMYLDGIDRQLIFEAGGRTSIKDFQETGVIGLGIRFQQTFGDRHVLRLDTFLNEQDSIGFGYGFRSEWMVKF